MQELFREKSAPKEIPPAEEIKTEEPEVEIDEKTREFSELASTAREKANSILEEAGKMKNGPERQELEKKAYRMYAALGFLGADVPGGRGERAIRLVEKGTITGFASRKSAEIFLEEAI